MYSILTYDSNYEYEVVCFRKEQNMKVEIHVTRSEVIGVVALVALVIAAIWADQVAALVQSYYAK